MNYEGRVDDRPEEMNEESGFSNKILSQSRGIITPQEALALAVAMGNKVQKDSDWKQDVLSWATWAVNLLPNVYWINQQTQAINSARTVEVMSEESVSARLNLELVSFKLGVKLNGGYRYIHQEYKKKL